MSSNGIPLGFAFRAEIVRDAHLDSILGKIENFEHSQVVREAFARSASVFARGARRRLAARLLHHRSSGALLRSVTYRMKGNTKMRSSKARGYVGFRTTNNREMRHAHLVDLGSVRRSTKAGYNRGVMPANYFYQETFSDDAVEAQRAFKDYIIKNIEKELEI